jgi:RimJ/RimL family protein N-acetyltransferase
VVSPNDVTIRLLTESDWEALREIRLRALRTEPGVFFRAHAEEIGKTDDEWKEWARGSDGGGRMFGLFASGQLVGITGAVPWREDPSGATVVLVASYIAPEYRGLGLTSLLYDARLTWIRSQPRFKRIIVSHRRTNEPSGKAIRRNGFTHVGTVSRAWPDGTLDDEVCYEMKLNP